MSEHTTEDFGKARFAESPEGRVAMRHSGRWSLESKFAAATMTGLSDEDMAVAGWRPVHEHNPHATDALEEEIQDLRDANAGLKTRVEYLDGELVLWQERLWQERASQAEAAPITLDTLREAWETAESLDACRSILSEGDVLIIKEPHDIYLVRPACEGVFVGRADAENARVLYRSPQPWQALADVLDDSPPWVERWRADEAARWLHERGVRVTGGDDRG